MASVQFAHPAGITISATLTEDELVEKIPSAKKRDMKTGWIWYTLPSFCDGDTIVHISLGFNNARLKMISLSDGNPRFGGGWDEWSEQKERERVESIVAWLAQEDIQIGDYSWGRVSAGVDPRGGCGEANVTFF